MSVESWKKRNCCIIAGGPGDFFEFGSDKLICVVKLSRANGNCGQNRNFPFFLNAHARERARLRTIVFSPTDYHEMKRIRACIMYGKLASKEGKKLIEAGSGKHVP